MAIAASVSKPVTAGSSVRVSATAGFSSPGARDFFTRGTIIQITNHRRIMAIRIIFNTISSLTAAASSMFRPDIIIGK